MRKAVIAICTIVGLTLAVATPRAQSGVLFVGMGDSIGEGVQSGDASIATQQYSFLNIMAVLMHAPFPQPYIQTSALGQVGKVSGRSRISPTVSGLNLAVSGADTADLLFTRADATTTAEINSETDLVLFPRRASQMEIAESLHPQRVACWIGNNDALAAVTHYDQLDGVSNMTSVADFQARFTQVAARLAAMGSQVVFGTIPDVTRIGFLINRDDMIRLTGQSYGLPDGVYTTVVTTFAIRLGVLDPSVLANPNYILDQAEAANINHRIADFNTVIKSTAAAYGMAVVDMAALFDLVSTYPPTLYGVPVRTRFLGGMFSLDGVHPSNFGQLLTAKVFIDTFNVHYGTSIPTVTSAMIVGFFLADPFIDKDGDGRVKGRPGAGLLETFGPIIGWSGDSNDALPTTPATRSRTPSQAPTLDAVERVTGKNVRAMSVEQRLDLLAEIFGLPHDRAAK